MSADSPATPMDASLDASPAGDSSSPPANPMPHDPSGSSALPPGPSVVPHGALEPSIKGPTVIDPFAPPSSALNPRSCVTCRRRKVRCDKHMPCSNCRKAQISCIFPAPGRAPRRPRIKDPNAPPKQSGEREAELMKRLRKLEGIVEELSGQVEDETGRHPLGIAASPDILAEQAQVRNRRWKGIHESPSHSYTALDAPESNHRTTYAVGTAGPPAESASSDLNREFGRLVLDDSGRTRYVNNLFWSKMNDELDALRKDTQRLTDEDSEESDGAGSSPTTLHSIKDQQSGDHQGFVLGYRSADVDLRTLQPLPSQIPFMWQVYQENVDPAVKILHVPTVGKAIRELRTNVTNTSGHVPGMEALLFSIYYAAITSMEEEEVIVNFGSEKTQLLQRYRFATEQALARANFLNTSEVVVLQAFVLFLFVVRRYDESRFAWSLTGLAIRIGQSIGIQRDGSNFDGLSPFDVEMRRRLWWYIGLLDYRSAEDHGSEPIIDQRFSDTKLPLHINDSDISPDSTEFPPERSEPTEMTFSLMRMEVLFLVRKLHVTHGYRGQSAKEIESTITERNRLLRETYDGIDTRYLQQCTEQSGDLLHWVAATITRLIMSKMSIVVYQPFLRHLNKNVSQDVCDQLFMSSVEVLEYNRILNVEPRCKPYRWLLKTYMPWYAVGFLLIEVCRRPWSPSSERGWVVLSQTFQNAEPAEYDKLAQNNAVWLPLRQLMTKAKRHRDEEIARLRAHPELAKQLDPDQNNEVPPASFQHLPSSVRNIVARDRWRKIVGRDGAEPKARPSGSAGGQPEDGPSSADSAGAENLQMKCLDRVMTEPSFNSADIFTVAWNVGATDIASEGDPRGRGVSQSQGQPQSGQPPRPLGTTAVADGIANRTEPTNHMDFTHGVSAPVPQATPASSLSMTPYSTMTDNQAPPSWMWSDLWEGGPTGMPAGGLPVMDDMDVSMDEDFSWQYWQDIVSGRAGYTGDL